MKYLLDTNICIYIIKKKPVHVINRFDKINIGDICISSITLAELNYGIQKSSNPIKNEKALESFLLPLEVLNFDYTATISYGIIRANLEKKGIPIGSLDTLIAAHAKSKKLTLVTNNEKEFNRVSDLKVENWAK